MSSKKPERGAISFRLSMDLLKDLKYIASILGLDMTSLVNEMLHMTRPEFLRRAKELEHEYQKIKEEA